MAYNYVFLLSELIEGKKIIVVLSIEQILLKQDPHSSVNTFLVNTEQ